MMLAFVVEMSVFVVAVHGIYILWIQYQLPQKKTDTKLRKIEIVRGFVK